MSLKEEIDRDLGSPILLSLKDAGITESYLAEKLKEELEATKVETFKGKSYKQVQRGKRWVSVVDTEEVIYSRPLIDWDIRQTARQDGIKYHLLLTGQPTEKIKHEGQVSVELSPNLRRMVDEIYQSGGSQEGLFQDDRRGAKGKPVKAAAPAPRPKRPVLPPKKHPKKKRR